MTSIFRDSSKEGPGFKVIKLFSGLGPNFYIMNAACACFSVNLMKFVDWLLRKISLPWALNG